MQYCVATIPLYFKASCSSYDCNILCSNQTYVMLSLTYLCCEAYTDSDASSCMTSKVHYLFLSPLYLFETYWHPLLIYPRIKLQYFC
jgi:hypothetical protein